MNILTNFGRTSYCDGTTFYLPTKIKDFRIFYDSETIPNNIIHSSLPLAVIVTGQVDRLNEYFKENLIRAITVRLRYKQYPTYFIYDMSWESHLKIHEIDAIKLFFKSIGVDIENNLLIINQHGFETRPEEQGELMYDIWSIDGLYWLEKFPDKFTNIPLIKRPNLANVILSKIKEKRSRAYLLYELYKRNLLNQCLLSSTSNVEEFSLHIDDNEFLNELKQRIDNIGGQRRETTSGYTSDEFMCETSNRTIFVNSRISCVNETSWFSIDSNNLEANGNHYPTEKFYRCVVNKTPFIVLSGSEGVLDKLKWFGFNTFDSIIDWSFNFENNGLKRISMYVDQIERFLKTSEDRIDEIQEICNYNYNVFYKTAKLTKQYYNNRIERFLGIHDDNTTIKPV